MRSNFVTYPVDNASVNLSRFPNLRARINLPSTGKSPLEIVRLLDNAHYDHILALLQMIERSILYSGRIGNKVLESKESFDFHRAISELQLLVHLRNRLPGQVIAVYSGPHAIQNDIDVSWQGITSHIEVYCPMDFVGFKWVDQYVARIIKYAEIDRGFRIKLSIGSTSGRDVSWPYFFEKDEKVISDWLRSFRDCMLYWLGNAQPESSCSVPGTNHQWVVEAKLIEFRDDPTDRSISSIQDTRSTDTRLFFESGTVEDTVHGPWGKRLKEKLLKKQAGDSASDSLRILVVDFSLADTGWPDFICWPEISRRMQDAVLHIAKGFAAPPFDIVLPAQLGMECCFGPPIWLDPTKQKVGCRFIEEADLNILCQPRGTTTDEDFEKILDLLILENDQDVLL